MELKDCSILMFERTMKLGGSSKVVLQMCEILKPYVKNIVVCSTGGVNVEYLEQIGIKHYIIKDISDLKNLPSNIKCISKIIENEEINIVHTHHRMAALYGQLLSRKYHIMKVATVHGEFYDKKIFTKIAYKKTNVIACGEKVKENLCQVYGIPSSYITVIRNAVKKEEYYEEIDILEELKKNNIFTFCYIGRLSEEKGLEYLIKSIPKLSDKIRGFRVIVVGTGLYKEEMISQAEKLGVSDKLIFLGHRNDAQNVIKQIDVVVLPSLTEGFPLTPMEAFANCKTVIATDVGGTTEIVENMQNGILVKSKDEDALCDAMLKLYNDKVLLMKLDENALKTYNEKFSYDTFKENIIRFYFDKKIGG